MSITLTVAVEGKPYRKSETALAELSAYAMRRYYRAWAARHTKAAERFFMASDKAMRLARVTQFTQYTR